MNTVQTNLDGRNKAPELTGNMAKEQENAETNSQKLGYPMEHYYYSPSIGCGSTRSLLRERLENPT